MRLILILSMVIAVAACGGRKAAPVYERSANPYKRNAPSSTRIERPSFYRVRKGDTLYSIAWRYGLDFRTLARWNGIRSPYVIFPDQRLSLKAPRTSTPPGTASTPTRPSSTRPTSNNGTTSTPPRKPASSTPSSSQISRPAPKPPRNDPPPQPAVRSNIDWQWPTEGEVIARFNASDPGANGIDISGRDGQAVIAAAAGEVVYSGVGLIGYGELVIIKHDQQFLSAYAHNRKRLVGEGDKVTAGQHIAEMGDSGADRTKLHFEIRRDGEPTDPLRYLPKR